MVHRTIWASGQVAKLSPMARLLFIGLITLGDDDGRLKGSPALIRSQIFPYDDDIKVADVAKMLVEIEAQKLVIGYEVEGEQCYFHPKWEEYQHIREDRRRESNIPAPTLDFLPVSTNGQPKGNRLATKRPLNISKDNINKVNIIKDMAFQTFWEKYPRKVSKKSAWKAWQKINFTDEVGGKIMKGLEAACESEQWVKDDGRYIPHPATWLNGERWEDEVVPSKNKKSSKYDKIGTTIRS